MISSATVSSRNPAETRGRAGLAASRAIMARGALANCDLCDHHCGVDRLSGEKGVCRAGASARVFSAQTEVSDELEICPTFAIALSGCDLRCDFCITGRESWNPLAGEPLDAADLAARATVALEKGARSVMILGGEPTVFLPDALEIAAALPEEATLVWKTNGHASTEARALLEDIFDIWVVDYKFGNDNCAERLARVSDYGKSLRENLCWAERHADLIVRHLLMPGHLECCWVPAARWIAENLPETKVSLRTGFWPAWKASRHPELTQSCSAREAERAFDVANDFPLRLIE